jgi:hypothetical protein
MPKIDLLGQQQESKASEDLRVDNELSNDDILEGPGRKDGARVRKD